MNINGREFVIYVDDVDIFLCPIIDKIAERIIRIKRHSEDEYVFLTSKIGKSLKNQKEFVFSTIDQLEKHIEKTDQSMICKYSYFLQEYQEIIENKCNYCKKIMTN